MRLLVFTLLITAAAWAQPKEMTDVLFIPAEPPFFVQVFETSNQKGADEGVIGLWSSYPWKPARFDYNEAVEYCEKVGGRLPTQAEWMEIATNLGENKKYTLRDDTLYDSSNDLKAYIQGSGSQDVYDFDTLGIDAIGTVGLTGNRPEYVVSPSSSDPIQCGGAYETRDTEKVELDKICKRQSRGDTGSATARCIFDYDPNAEYVLNYSEKVTGELKTYIANLEMNNYMKPIDPFNADPKTAALIPENKWSSKEDDDAELLEYLDPDSWLDD